MANRENILCFRELNSTNTWLKEQYTEYDLPHGFAVRADYQTKGRGQATNSWEGERGKNVLCSLFLKPFNIELHEQFVLSQIISIAIVESLQALVEEEVKIKWPNDIYVADKKVCGISIESSILGNMWSSSIVGIGINVNQMEFLSDALNPVSIKQLSGRDNDVQDVFLDVLGNILRALESYSTKERDALKKEYFSSLYRSAGYYLYEDVETSVRFMAEIENIGEMGHITLKEKVGNIRIYAFKEVKFISV